MYDIENNAILSIDIVVFSMHFAKFENGNEQIIFILMVCYLNCALL